MPYLAFNLNDGNEFIFDLIEDRLSLGRNPRNEIVIENNQISSFHAEFARQPNGAYLLTDLKSTNVTFVNGHSSGSGDRNPDVAQDSDNRTHVHHRHRTYGSTASRETHPAACGQADVASPACCIVIHIGDGGQSHLAGREDAPAFRGCSE